MVTQNSIPTHTDLESKGGELVIGFVAPTGTDSKKIHRVMKEVLADYGYSSHEIRISRMLADPETEELTGVSISDTDEYSRVASSMDSGDAFRSKVKMAEAMALLACAAIAEKRDEHRIAMNHEQCKPMSRIAHIVHSLKRPEEVIYLNRVYGGRFFVISINTPRSQRQLTLQDRMTESEAVSLISRDELGEPRKVESEFTQATAKTFHMADLFVDGSKGDGEICKALRRFFDLVFGSPLVTPTLEEHAMFLAHGASLRSGDLSRQVGAVITTSRGEMVAEGANDAPCAFGGQYWPGEDDQRDLARGFDSNEKVKEEMIASFSRELAKSSADEAPSVSGNIRAALKRSGFLGLTEFGRAVHAEMAALMSCARRGVSSKGGMLFCTTFPCHNCAKHIVAAGIEEVYYIEPYPKSRAVELHSDSLTLSDERKKVTFKSFTGVGPKRYSELFMLRDAHGNELKRKAKAGEVISWHRLDKSPSLPSRLINYIEQERRTAAWIEEIAQSTTTGDGRGRVIDDDGG